jgi:hypothetical protein
MPVSGLSGTPDVVGSAKPTGSSRPRRTGQTRIVIRGSRKGRQHRGRALSASRHNRPHPTLTRLRGTRRASRLGSSHSTARCMPDMPATGLPIACEHCGLQWHDGDYGISIFGFGNIDVELKNNATNCPRCGAMTALPEGNFAVRGGRWRLVRSLADCLRSADATADDYARLGELLRQAQAAQRNADQVADDITAQTPFGKWRRPCGLIHRAGFPGSSQSC